MTSCTNFYSTGVYMPMTTGVYMPHAIPTIWASGVMMAAYGVIAAPWNPPKPVKLSPAQRRAAGLRKRAEEQRLKNLPGWLMGHGSQGQARPTGFKPPGKCPMKWRAT